MFELVDQIMWELTMVVFGLGFVVGAVVTGFVARYRPEWFSDIAARVESKIAAAKVAATDAASKAGPVS